MNTIKIISISIPVDLEYRTLWSKSKGYNESITFYNPETGLEEIKPNPETLEDFFLKTLKNELLNIAINPINNMIYTEINKQAQEKITALNAMTQENLKIEIKDL